MDILEEPTRMCKKCMTEKPLSAFPPGRYSCTSCIKLKEKLYRMANREHRAAYQKNYRLKNIEKRRTSSKIWYSNHKGYWKEYNKTYYPKNRKKILVNRKRYDKEHKKARREYRRKYAREHPDIIRMRKKRYYIKHRDKILKHQKKYIAAHREQISARRKANYYIKNKDKIIAREIARHEKQELLRKAKEEHRLLNLEKRLAQKQERKARSLEKKRVWRRAWYQKNKNKIRLLYHKNKHKKLEYYQKRKNDPAVIKKKKDYYLKNWEKIRAYQKRYKDAHKVDSAVYHQYYANLNKDKLAAAGRKWRENNKNKMREYQTRPHIKIRVSLAGRIRMALKAQGAEKNQDTLSYVGCTIAFLHEHLEKQFLPGMTWNNYGRNGWHIDHIIPCKYFDLTKEDEQNVCFHYINLQPLWEPDNFSKNDTLPDSETIQSIKREIQEARMLITPTLTVPVTVI